jgi:hypothetical protein
MSTSHGEAADGFQVTEGERRELEQRGSLTNPDMERTEVKKAVA